MRDPEDSQDSLHQSESDVVVEEEEVSMEFGGPNAGECTPLLGGPQGAPSPLQQGSHADEQLDPNSNDPNPTADSDLDEDQENELLRVQDVTIPGGHLDDSVTIGVNPNKDTL